MKGTGKQTSPMLVFDRASSRAVDRACVEEYGIPGIVLMENASRGLADAALEMLGGSESCHGTTRRACRAATPIDEGSTTRRSADESWHDAAGRRALIVCGGGNNGGDGFALARHLHNASARVVIVVLREPKPDSDAGINFAICRKMNLTLIGPEEIDDFRNADLIVDAIFGTGLDGPIEGPAGASVQWINEAGPPVLAVDTPSGLDCDTGRPLGACVEATRTVTFLGMKKGFLQPAARRYTGEVTVAQIGAPRELLEKFGTNRATVRPEGRAVR